MVNKSIKELERYKDHLFNKKQDIISQIYEMVIYGESSASSSISYVNSIIDIISLLENEIKIACLSNNIDEKEEKDTVSINQAMEEIIAYDEKIDFYENMYNYLCVKNKEKGIMEPVIVNKFGELVLELKDKKYSLNEKIERAKNEVKVEIDMGNFVVNMVED